MSDQYIPLGQQFPPNTQSMHGAGQRMPMPAMVSDSEASDLSFQAVLNRQQSSQSQLKAASPESYMAYKKARMHNSASQQATAPQQRTALVSSQGVQSNAQQQPASVNDVTLPPQAQEMIKNAPADIPQGEDLYKTMIRNAQEYQQQKTENGPSQSETNPFMATSKANAPQAKVQISPMYSGFDVQETVRQPINAEIMHNQSSEQRSNNPYHSAFSMNPEANASARSYEPSASQLNQQAMQSNQQVTTGQPQSYQASAINQGVMEQVNQITSEEQTQNDEPDAMDEVGSFFKNIASGLTLGFYQPEDEPKPEGMMRVFEPFKSLVWDAPKSLLVGVPMGIANSFDADDQGGKAENQSTQVSSGNEISRDTVAFSNSRRHSSSKPWLS